MEEWMFFLWLINTVMLVLLRRRVKKLDANEETLSLKISCLSTNIETLTRTIRKGGLAPQQGAEPLHAPVEASAASVKSVVKQPVDPAPLKTSGVAVIEVPPPVPVNVPKRAAVEDAPVMAIEEVEASVPEKESELVVSAKEILSRIWRWVVFGDEERREGVSAEVSIATTWLIRTGIIVVVTGAMYFLKWSFDAGLISPEARVGTSMLSGIGLLVFGIRLLGKKYHLMGQGLIGGGLLILYGSSFAAGPVFHLFGSYSLAAAFALMILVTVAGGIVAVKTDSMLVAIIGIAGGFMTPVMLRTPTPNLPGFYSYILMLSIGIMAIAYYKQWRLLNYLGFVAAYGLFFGSLGSAYKPDDFVVAISFLSAFLVVHSAIVYLHNIARGNKSTTLEIIHLVANALCFAGGAFWLIDGKYGRPYPAIMSLALAVFYVTHVLVFLKKRLADRALLIALIALAGGFSTWTLPLLLERETLTISLSLLAFMFLWIGRRLRSNFLENLAHLVYCIVFFRLVYYDIPENFSIRPSAGATMAVYWKAMAGRLLTFGVSIASVIAGFFVQKSESEELAGDAIVTEVNDTPVVVGRSIVSSVFYWFAIGFIFLFAHLELNTMFMYFAPFRLPVLTVLWCVMGAYFLVRHLSGNMRGTVDFYAMCAFLFLAVIKVYAVDLASWNFCDRFIYDMEYSLLYAGTRFLDFGVLMTMFLCVWLMAGVKRKDSVITAAFGYGALFLLFVYATLEVNSLLFWKLSAFQKGGISILWAVFAVGFISGGIWKNLAPLRYVGLALFAIVAGKVFLVDMAHMEMIYRVVAFVVVGVFLLLGAFAYLYSGKKFMKGGQS